MADKKISQLPVATSSAGTDVLPIVQSSTTKQLAIQNLVPQNLKSNATTGVLQVNGPAAATTRVMTTPDANFTVARTDAANSFTGDQTLSTGNLVIGTSGKGIDFSITPQPAGSTSELLADYEEGTWTATLKGGVSDPTTPVTTTGYYTKVGRQVTINCYFANIDTTGASNVVSIIGLPYTPANNAFGPASAFLFDFSAGTTSLGCSVTASSTTLSFLTSGDSVGWNSLQHLAGTGRYLGATVTYFV